MLFLHYFYLLSKGEAWGQGPCDYSGAVVSDGRVSRMPVTALQLSGPQEILWPGWRLG